MEKKVMIEAKDVITLSDNNKYGVVSKETIDNNVYYYLVDINDYNNIKFCRENKLGTRIELIEIKDQNVIKNLISCFCKTLKNEMEENN